MNTIHKPLDRILKAFPDEAPRIFLHAVGTLDLHAEASIEVFPTETAPPVKLPDYVFKIVLPQQPPFLLHVEFEAVWHSRTPALIARRGGSLAWQYEIPVQSLLVLIRPDGCPATLPDVAEYAVGETRTTHPCRAVRMWELDPEPLLQSENRRVLPWAVLMKSTDKQVRALAREVLATGDEELIGRLSILGGVRYDEEDLERVTGVPKMDLVELILQESSIVKVIKKMAHEEGQAAGLAKGEAAGLAKGQADEARRLLSAVLASRFPGLETMPELSAISDLGTLESLLVDHVVPSFDRERTEEAIRAAAKSSSL